jgi:thiol-disulfide isomerase/thioredoxin
MKITAEKIRSLSTETSFERGMDYFTHGRVKNIAQFGNKITAIVSGTEDYQVTIRLKKDDFTAECTCPYNWGGYCKHIVATVLALSKNYKDIKKQKVKEEEKIDTILNNITLEELKDFLRIEFENDSSLRDAFVIHFTGKGSKDRSIYDYKKQVNLLYRTTSGRDGYIEYGNNVNFIYFYDLALRYAKKKNFLEAAKIYQALAETIAENMDIVDDSDGYYGRAFGEAIEDFINCINEANLGHKEKRCYIQYLFSKYIENDPDYFQENYNYALQEICHLKEDLTYWKELLTSYIPDSLPDEEKYWIKSYQSKLLIEMQLFILDKLNKKEQFYSLIKSHYREDTDLCLLYAKRLKKDSESDKSLAIAEEGLRIFHDGLTSKLRIFLNPFYEKSSPEKHKENLKHQFFQGYNWNYYDELKKLYSDKEWQALVQEIITHLASKDRYSNKGIVIDIYLREKKFDKAIEKVLHNKSLDVLERYYKDLSNKYPEEYFNAYKELLIPFADSKTGRHHYRNIVYYLKRMKKIGIFKNQFREFVKELKEKYANRPAFHDEMERI